MLMGNLELWDPVRGKPAKQPSCAVLSSYTRHADLTNPVAQSDASG